MPRRAKDPGHLISRPPGYNFSDVLALTTATRSNLIHWTNIGIIKAEIEDTSGPGFPRRFSPLNVIEAELAAVINGFRVPAETIRGALTVFRDFHRGAAALHAEATGAPLVTGRFQSLDHRRREAQLFIRHVAFTGDGPREHAAERARQVAAAWNEMRQSDLIRGIPDPRFSNHFLGLFISGMSGTGEATFATVALDPPNLRLLIDGRAIVVDLATVMFRVGQRMRSSHGLSIGAW